MWTVGWDNSEALVRLMGHIRAAEGPPFMFYGSRLNSPPITGLKLKGPPEGVPHYKMRR